ncbi:hypothetical protein MPSEU_000244500 [Mayamaea pseudoterrestris]|nr:hypothetical protein MPSEU_000244500 [Mayamaea pseudoterrestris]
MSDTTKTTENGGSSRAPASSSIDSGSCESPEVDLVGFQVGPNLLTRYAMNGELVHPARNESVEMRNRSKQVVQDPAVDHQLSNKAAVDATPSINSSSNRKTKSASLEKNDAIDHSHDVEICLQASAFQELSSLTLIHDMSPQNEVQNKLNLGRENEDSPNARQPSHQCQVSPHGIELVLSRDSERGMQLPLATDASTLVSAQTPTRQSRTYIVTNGVNGTELIPRAQDKLESSLPAETEAATNVSEPTALTRLNRSYNVKNHIEDEDKEENEVDIESIAVSSLWSSGRDEDTEASSFSGTFSSGSGLLDDETMTAYTGGPGFPSNVYCFAFVDDFDDRLCTGDIA